MSDILSRVSTESTRDATGHGWTEWLKILDRAGAADWSHRRIVSHLEAHHPEVSSWWRQTISVGYEQARGKRLVGQTASVGFEVGVQRSTAATLSKTWEVIVSQPDLWLGNAPKVAAGEEYSVRASKGLRGARGEFRVVKPRDRLRMTGQPAGWTEPATLQLTVPTSTSGKTAIHAHLEKLPSAKARDEMRGYWRAALERIVAATS